MNLPRHNDEIWMRLALEEARLTAEAGEVPVGAVVVRDETLLGRGGNRTRRDRMVAAHAELVALTHAQQAAGDYRLDGATIYITVEPCLMCLGAIQQSRVERIVYGAPEPKFGAVESRFELGGHEALRKMSISGGLLAAESSRLLADFFNDLRQRRELP
jgi:tRNA(adenine34) deaminase